MDITGTSDSDKGSKNHSFGKVIPFTSTDGFSAGESLGHRAHQPAQHTVSHTAAWRDLESQYRDVVIDDLDDYNSYEEEKSGIREMFSSAGRQIGWYGERVWTGARVVFTLHALIICATACASVFVCGPGYLDLAWDTNFSIISLGSVFPVVYTINQAFNRREKAADVIAQLKATCTTMYWMHRDWDKTSEPGTGDMCADNIFTMCQEFLANVRHFIKIRMGDRRMANIGAMYLQRCYLCLSTMSVLNERLGVNVGYKKGGEGGMSRASQYLRYLSAELEQLRIVREYRTPRGLRYASQFLIHASPILLSPYFRYFATQGTQAAGGYFAAICYCLVLCMLLHIQEDMEDPFDLVGMDDLHFAVPEELGAVYMTDTFNIAEDGRVIVNYHDPLPENDPRLLQLIQARELAKGSQDARNSWDSFNNPAWKIAVSLSAPDKLFNPASAGLKKDMMHQALSGGATKKSFKVRAGSPKPASAV